MQQILDKEVKVVLAELEKSLKVVGDVVELGCYMGDTSLLMGKMLKQKKSEKQLWLYDSFEGLPEKTAQDSSSLGENFKLGELKATKAEVMRKFMKSGLLRPIVKKAWFDDLDVATDLPKKISFALLDGDYYESLKTSFALVRDKMTEGAIIAVHDYQNEALPGAAKAVDEFCARNPKLKMQVKSGLAIIYL